MTHTLCFETLHSMSYSAPCPLSSFLRQWKTKEIKGIFPHGYYSKIEELETTEFPPKEAFFDSIKNKKVDENLYNEVKTEYERRLLLPENDPYRFRNMKCYLKYYNLLGRFFHVKLGKTYF